MTPKLIIGNKNYSSWSLRGWLLLREAGIEFDEHRISLDVDTTASEIATFNPGGTVPVLQLGDLTVWDTLAIAETAAERWPDKQLWPADADARAYARSICAEMHAGFAVLRDCMPMNCRAHLPGKGRAPGVEHDIARIVALWRDCRERYGAGGDMLFGEFGIADAMFAPVVTRFVTYDVALDPVARDYADAVWALPAVEGWVAAARAEPERIESEEL